MPHDAPAPDSDRSAALRALPAVSALVEEPALAALVARAGHAEAVAAARQIVEEARARLLSSTPSTAAAIAATTPEALQAALRRRLESWLAPAPTCVVNATGVVLHTNLGRAPVSRGAADAMARAALGYSDLEYELDEGRRGSRHDLLVDRLRRLTGAEAALVVNNNAGATMLVLSALARDRGVIVSRGQLVEIGGGYRIPEVMAAGGARLVEVGTTNRTHPRDYESAIDEDVALLLRVHTSNYRLVGFTTEVSLEEMVAICRRHGITVVDDLGSGSLLDTARYGLAPEPLVQQSIAAGADLVTFSGDKLLGGPQAGLIVGRADLVERLRSYPLTRALRPGKATLAGLAATLDHYLRGEAEREVPVWRMLAAQPAALRERAGAWSGRIAEALGADSPTMRLVAGHSTVGGGSLPGESLPTTLLAIEHAHPDRLAAALRAARTPVIARVADGALLLDPRTVLPGDEAGGEDETLVAALVGVLRP